MDNLNDVERLIRLLRDNELNELFVKDGEFEFRARRGEPVTVAQAPMIAQGMPQLPMATGMASGSAAPAAAPAGIGAGGAPAASGNEVIVRSPLVGTFYRRPSPDKEMFVEVGDEITEETVVGLVEALKVYNEIKADVSGTVLEILVDDSTPVEFDTPILRVRPLK